MDTEMCWEGSMLLLFFIVTVLGISNIREVTCIGLANIGLRVTDSKALGTGISNVVRGAGMRQWGIVETVANPLVHSPS